MGGGVLQELGMGSGASDDDSRSRKAIGASMAKTLCPKDPGSQVHTGAHMSVRWTDSDLRKLRTAMAEDVPVREAGFMLPYPVSANRYWKGAGRHVYVSAEAKAYKAQAAHLANQSGITEPTGDLVSLALTVHPVEPKDAAARAKRAGQDWHYGVRCMDIDNAIKVTLDALQGVVYVNDNQVAVLYVERGLPVPGGGLSVRIGEVK
jgi:crossover junction endodeoxyribonuclease RusA